MHYISVASYICTQVYMNKCAKFEQTLEGYVIPLNTTFEMFTFHYVIKYARMHKAMYYFNYHENKNQL